MVEVPVVIVWIIDHFIFNRASTIHPSFWNGGSICYVDFDLEQYSKIVSRTKGAIENMLRQKSFEMRFGTKFVLTLIAKSQYFGVEIYISTIG